MRSFLKRKISFFYSFFSKALLLNSFLSIISLPFLAHWGLPVSLMTIFGNILFSPILTIFLIVSSLLFFLELLCIPNGILVLLTDLISSFWIKLAALGSKKWLLAFSEETFVILYLGTFASLAIIIMKKISKQILTWLMFALLFFIITCSQIIPSKQAIHKITIGKLVIFVIQSKGSVAIIDTGILGKRTTTIDWIDYNLTPFIFKKTGATKINDLFILNPQERSTENLGIILKKISIENVHENFNNISSYNLGNFQIIIEPNKMIFTIKIIDKNKGKQKIYIAKKLEKNNKKYKITKSKNLDLTNKDSSEKQN